MLTAIPKNMRLKNKKRAVRNYRKTLVLLTILVAIMSAILYMPVSRPKLPVNIRTYTLAKTAAFWCAINYPQKTSVS
jgi:hypothetical protein